MRCCPDASSEKVELLRDRIEGARLKSALPAVSKTGREALPRREGSRLDRLRRPISSPTDLRGSDHEPSDSLGKCVKTDCRPLDDLAAWAIGRCGESARHVGCLKCQLWPSEGQKQSEARKPVERRMRAIRVSVSRQLRARRPFEPLPKPVDDGRSTGYNATGLPHSTCRPTCDDQRRW
jgi:hypothetical protein